MLRRVWRVLPLVGLCGCVSTQELFDDLQDKDPKLRKMAINRLGDRWDKLGDRKKEYKDALLAALNDPVPRVRARAAAWTPLRLGEAAVPHLLDALDDDDPYVSYNAASQLLYMGGISGIGKGDETALCGPLALRIAPALIRFLESPWGTRVGIEVSAAARELGAMGAGIPGAASSVVRVLPTEFSSFGSRTAEALHRLALSAPRSETKPLAKLLRRGYPRRRLGAAMALGWMGARAGEAVPDLVAALEDEDMWVQLSAAISLGRIGRGADTAVPALARLLDDEWDRFRKQAAFALWSGYREETLKRMADDGFRSALDRVLEEAGKCDDKASRVCAQIIKRGLAAHAKVRAEAAAKVGELRELREASGRVEGWRGGGR